MKHKRLQHIVLLFIIASLYAACNKDGSIDCLKSTGTIKKESRYVAAYTNLEVNDNINLFLTQDTLVNSLEVEAGENLLTGITTRVDNGRLFIRNENTCNWLRPFDVPINVYISYSRLDTIVARTAGNMTFLTPWQTDSIQFDVWEGAGTINLRLDVGKSRVYVHYGVVEINLSGKSTVSYISNKGYGPVNAFDLNTDYTFLSTKSPNDCYVSVNSEIGVTIDNIGNVYYKGNPNTVNEVSNSTGRLIPLN